MLNDVHDISYSVLLKEFLQYKNLKQLMSRPIRVGVYDKLPVLISVISDKIRPVFTRCR